MKNTLAPAKKAGSTTGFHNGFKPHLHLFDGVGLDESLLAKLQAAFGQDLSVTQIKKLDFRKINTVSDDATISQLFSSVILVDLSVLETVRARISPSMLDKVSVIAVGNAAELHDQFGLEKLISAKAVVDIIEDPVTPASLILSLRKVQTEVINRIEIRKLHDDLDAQASALKKLNDIGIALSSETDIHKLLDLILTISIDITGCDSGSLYILQDKPDVEYDKHNYLKNKVLCFKHTYNYTKSIPFKEFTMEISDKSLSGYTALTGNILNLEDVYFIPEGTPYHFNKSFDDFIKYRTKSMLVVPMLNREKQTIGVIQLINKKRDKAVKLDSEQNITDQVIPFTQKDEELTLSFASQAAVAYENRSLYESIKILFEGFIKASVTAIEARDPTTSGHSERVATLSVGIAEAVNKAKTSLFSGIQFNWKDLQEIKYASLLHDFGKIGVREPVLVKAKKLYEGELELLKSRYLILRQSMKLAYCEQKVRYLLDQSRDKALPLIQQVDAEAASRLKELDDYLEFIIKTNEPTVLESAGFDLLQEIKTRRLDVEGVGELPFLTEHEVRRLSIKKGSLGEDERLEIESHVTHTFNFLKQIPWTNDLRHVPKIAYMHHEKLDGSGYPQKAVSDQIPIQSKIMTISDIFDALTANDRPYKRAVPVEKALDILGYEVKAKKVDETLFNLFVEAKVYSVIEEKPAS
ncbi:MAG: GAF domain-containing protein [Bacteroidetes bacterium]|nr:GAF domain-containing protein [Bacteroidota bacterium]